MPRKARSHRGTTSRRPTTISIRTRSTSGSGKKFLTASVPTRKRFGSLTMSLKTVVASSARNWATKAAPPVRRTRPCMSSRRPRAPSIAKSTATLAIPTQTSITATSVKKTSQHRDGDGAETVSRDRHGRAADPGADGRMATAHRRRNLDGLLSLLTDDVVFLTPGNPPISKEHFAKGFQDVSAKARIEAIQDVKETRASGDIAAAWSHLTIVLTPKQSGKTSEASGYVLSVFQRSPSGKWLLARDANLVAGAGNPDRV